MIPHRLQIGTADLDTWRAVPAPCNPRGAEQGAWAVVAGGQEDADLYMEITAEAPKRVAEFVVDAVREHGERTRFAGAVADAEHERRRQRSRGAGVTPGNPHLADAVKLACLTEAIGGVARELTYDPAGGDRAERDKRLYSELAQLAAGVLGWMEAILSREEADE